MTCASDRLRAGLALALALALGACGDEAAVPPDGADTAGADGMDAAADIEAPDAEATDSGPAEVDAADTASAPDTSRPPGFELGWNTQGANDPASFNPLADGDELEIVLGPQGLWMVVLAFRTRGIFTGPLELLGTVTVDGVEQGRLGLIGQNTFPGPEGWSYYYNFFLVVNDPTVGGEDGTVFLRASDGAQTRELSHIVKLSGGQ